MHHRLNMELDIQCFLGFICIGWDPPTTPPPHPPAFGLIYEGAIGQPMSQDIDDVSLWPPTVKEGWRFCRQPPTFLFYSAWFASLHTWWPRYHQPRASVKSKPTHHDGNNKCRKPFHRKQFRRKQYFLCRFWTVESTAGCRTPPPAVSVWEERSHSTTEHSKSHKKYKVSCFYGHIWNR